MQRLGESLDRRPGEPAALVVSWDEAEHWLEGATALATLAIDEGAPTAADASANSMTISADALRHGIALQDSWAMSRAPVRVAGEIVGRHEWGTRPTAYEVRKHTEADYHLLQFEGTPELLNQLNHALKITDGVNRFRIIKLRKGTPEPPDLTLRATAPDWRGAVSAPPGRRRATAGAGR